jgi:hypothetical protein
MNGETFRPPIARLLWNCDDLRRYLANNTESLIDYGDRYRSKLPISTSRAEGWADEIANARMAKKQRMRWSPQGAHRISTVRAAVLDGRLKAPVGLRSLPSRPEFFHSRESIAPLQPSLPMPPRHCMVLAP